MLLLFIVCVLKAAVT